MTEDFKFLADDKICESLIKVKLTKEELENLVKRDPLLFFLRYSSLIDNHNYFLNSAKHFKAHVNDLLNLLKSKNLIIDFLKNENSQLGQELACLKLENTRLQAQLAPLSQRPGRAGRPRYDSDFRQRVIDFYNESPAHTYQITANEFGISTNTVGRILKESA